MESTNVPMSKRLIGIALAAVFIVGSIFIPGSETLGHEGVMTLGLLLALVSLWVTSALPLGVTALFIIVMCPVLGIVGGLGQAIGGFASPALFFIILGTDNGVNFTDGLDGLCTSVTILVATFFTIVAIGENSGISPITGAVVGSLLGFLLFNVYPARVFMGDTGSLALGGFVASSAFMMQMPIFIAIVGLIYLVEVLSVIIQVTYFKKTGGKRFFKMAPIHHHFELCGWSETRVVGVFSIITAILCLIAYLGL